MVLLFTLNMWSSLDTVKKRTLNAESHAQRQKVMKEARCLSSSPVRVEIPSSRERQRLCSTLLGLEPYQASRGSRTSNFYCREQKVPALNWVIIKNFINKNK